MRRFFLPLLFCSMAFPLPLLAAPYCLAVRGNGENVAAHWAALARLTEENGLPRAAAGGSSGAITLFLLDALASNPAWSGNSSHLAARRAHAFLLKSLPAFLGQLAEQDHLVDLYEFLARLREQDSDTVQRLLRELAQGGAFSRGDVERIFKKYAPLVNPELVRGLLGAPGFFRGETSDAVRTFGKFNVKQDAHLFLRPGLADFRYFSLLLGAIADFYAGESPEGPALATLARDCGDVSYLKLWEELPAGCRARFEALAATYLKRGEFPHRALFRDVGENLNAFPTTAVIEGSAARRFLELRRAYLSGRADPAYGEFRVNDALSELRFGYWGRAAELNRINSNLEGARRAGDEKARRFEALGSANWFEVLSVSPAEPGLASFQPLAVRTSRAEVLSELKRPLEERWRGLTLDPARISAGGWSDLHPVEVLRAAGCEHVVYLTRQDGDSLFSQQVFIRLSGSQAEVPFWERLAEKNDAGWPAEGAVAGSAWHRLFNLANAQSSFRRALAEADAVYCTNWNRFRVFEGEMSGMVRDAYRAPVFLKNGAPEELGVNPARAGAFPGCLAP